MSDTGNAPSPLEWQDAPTEPGWHFCQFQMYKRILPPPYAVDVKVADDKHIYANGIRIGSVGMHSESKWLRIPTPEALIEAAETVAAVKAMFPGDDAGEAAKGEAYHAMKVHLLRRWSSEMRLMLGRWLRREEESENG